MKAASVNITCGTNAEFSLGQTMKAGVAVWFPSTLGSALECGKMKTKTKKMYFSIQCSPISETALLFGEFPGLAPLFFW